MHRISFILIWLLGNMGISMAQEWHVTDSCAKWKQQIKNAMVEAITMAETALDVLNNNRNDEQVKQMIKFIIGDRNEDLEYAKILLRGVAAFSKTETDPYDEVNNPFTHRYDLLIYCDPSNFYVESPTRVYSITTGDEIDPSIQDVLRDLYDTQASQKPVFAFTLRSGILDMEKYMPLVDAWHKSGSHGAPPSREPYVGYKNFPNTINLGPLILESGGNSIGVISGGYSPLDDNIIKIVRDPAYIQNLPEKSAAVDGLIQTLTGVILHELTHTDLGGRSMDSTLPPGCYGWKCVTMIQDQSNADSIAALALGMTLWKKKSIWINFFGQLEAVPAPKMRRRSVQYLPRYPPPVLVRDLDISPNM